MRGRSPAADQEDAPLTREEIEAILRECWVARCRQISDASYRWMGSRQALEEARERLRRRAGQSEALERELVRRNQEVAEALESLAEMIVYDATVKEKAQMFHPWRARPDLILKWAVTEANSADPLQRQRWRCVFGAVPNQRPPPS